MLNSEIAKEMVYIYIKKSNEIRMLVHIKEISKKKEHDGFFTTFLY